MQQENIRCEAEDNDPADEDTRGNEVT